MGRVAIREAIADYLTPKKSGITYLSTVFAHPPKITKEQLFFEWQRPTAAAGAVIYVFMGNEYERRQSSGGAHSGIIHRYYAVDLVCFLRSREKKSEIAEYDNDTFIDSLIAYLEATRNLGTAPTTGKGYVWQAGEGNTYGSRDRIVDASMPQQIRLGVVQTFSVVHLTVIEEVFA